MPPAPVLLLPLMTTLPPDTVIFPIVGGVVAEMTFRVPLLRLLASHANPAPGEGVIAAKVPV